MTPAAFTRGDRVRYRPGTGTYGYEQALEADGRVPGVVLGFSRTRIRVQLFLTEFGRTRSLSRCVDAVSLIAEPREGMRLSHAD